MFSKLSIAALVFVAMTAPALAGHCPVDMQKIDAALETTELSGAELAKVQGLRTKGEQMHKTGKHDKSEEALHEAMKILGIEH